MAVRRNNKEKPSNSIKDTASKILAEKGISYDEWLDEAHKKLIFENLDIINEGLELRKEFSSDKEID
ncbi:hypothetical protein ACSXBY_15980 (plasmid) [Clostridium perfringens]|uniref:hypothetical protein n=1 Tax=Clostridium perfringens TaxID=1502 RepID=UPI00155D9FEB|nr:hypothetical protein [Clostridium perfringens]MBI6029632.1 hypothetical protein [Clostridium perfringens]MBI6033015.1 hypothetical protein [Clostridium perfringens]MCX0401959.1 hypothetical protein [Clostridium perfringens]MDM0701383.1 hypothetical protein [Clostridium perfringens]MDV5113379.1 hypothetical protein [Clostridium perfringens]